MRSKLYFALVLLLSADTALADSFSASGALNLTIGTVGVSGTAGLLYSNGTTLESLAATYGTDPNQSSFPGNVLAFGNNIGIALTQDGTTATAGLTITNTSTTGGYGNLLELYASIGGTKGVNVYFDNSGNQYSRLGSTLSGHVSGTNPHQQILIPNGYINTMYAVWEDVWGPNILTRDSSGTPQEQVIQGLTWDGRSTIALNAAQSEVIFGNQTVGSGQIFLGDTFFARGNAAALLQIGGPDNVTPIAQTLAASGAPAPVTAQAVSGAAGQANVDLYVIPSAAVMQKIQVGMVVTDTTTSGVIPANTTVTAIFMPGQQFTLSNNITGSGVQFNDTLVFSTPNTAGSALTIAGGRGTGAGAGGSTCFGYAPAGSSGSSQNAWVCEGTINGSGLTLGVQGTLQGALTLANTASTYAVTLQSSNSATGAYTLTLPTAAPTSNGQTLSVTTAGIASWVTPGAASISIGSTVTSGTTGYGLYVAPGPVLGQFAYGSGVFNAIETTANATGGVALVYGTPTAGNCLKWNAGGIQDAGAACGSGGGMPSFPETVAGTTTSGGIPYFSSTTQLSSSGLLAANALMIGGGAGAAPSTTTTGTGVLTALGIAVGNTGGMIVGTNTGASSFNLGIGTTTNFGTGFQNMALGYGALGGCTSCSSNVGVGENSLDVITSGTDNTAVGQSAIASLTTGSYNTGIGVNALYSLVDGAENVGIGRSAGYNIVHGSGNTVIGSLVYPSSDVSNVIMIGAGLSSKIDYNYTTSNTWTATGNFASTGGFIAEAAAPTVSASQIGYGGTTAASSSCGSLSSAAGCVVVNVAGTTHYIPYY